MLCKAGYQWDLKSREAYNPVIPQLVSCRVQGADAEAEMARLMVDRADPTNTYVYAGNLPPQVRPIPHGRPVLLCWQALWLV